MLSEVKVNGSISFIVSHPNMTLDTMLPYLKRDIEGLITAEITASNISDIPDIEYDRWGNNLQSEEEQ